MVINKEHLTISGLHKIVAIKASMNLGLSKSLQAAFQDIIPNPRPIFNNLTIEPEWLAGFASAVRPPIRPSVRPSATRRHVCILELLPFPFFKFWHGPRRPGARRPLSGSTRPPWRGRHR